ncbi:protocadherin Fat 4-like [Oopsacas minuta]|uniref:Protocadherin Fat 4-like n=1 Tax=Oopsacas minuta TaxID=111878 RepID=A0AAV7KDJ0_9METZ|nr:protocadherin Fat 4-like [Oopsacas minuta]
MSRILLLLLFIHILISLLLVNGQIIFDNEPYRTDLNEETPINTVVLTVSAIDLSITSTTGMYSITSDEFIIDSLEGSVRTNSIIDREESGTPLLFAFDVTYVSDIGNVGTSTITISIKDINDNTPSFTNSTFYITIPEYTPVDTIIHIAVATDADTVSIQESVDGNGISVFNYTIDFGRVLYYIVGGNGSNYFNIDVDSGEIKTMVGDIDFDSIPSLTLNISAQDGPGLTAYALLVITIEDINDNTPIIIYPNSFSITLSEAVSVDLILVENITSMDLDHGLNADVTYSVSISNQSDSFSIDPTSGRVVLISPLDRDLDSVVSLTILATDGGTLALSSSIIITIILTDVNDNTPTFSNDVFMFDLMEDIVNGSTVYEFIAVDNDEAIMCFYVKTLTGQSIPINLDPNVTIEDVKESIEESTGIPVLSQRLLFASHELDDELTVQECGIVSDTTVHLNLELSGGAKKRKKKQYSTPKKNKHKKKKEKLLALKFYKVDDNGKVTRLRRECNREECGAGVFMAAHFDRQYSLSHSHFHLSPDTGVLSLIQTLDRETTGEYTFAIIAFDFGTPIPTTGSAIVNVTVLDVNDNFPIFNSSYFELHILDTEIPILLISTVTAQDNDIGTNGDITYSFTPDSTNPFAIDSITGDITLTNSVSYSLSNEWHNYTVNAMDSAAASEQRTGFTQLSIRVHEPDSSPPVFSQSSYNTTVPENTTVNTVILTVTATDIDRGINGDIRYYIVEEDNAFCYNLNECGIAGTLGVNPITGNVIVSSPLDRDIRESLSFQIIAYDGGYPVAMNDTTNVTIFLSDSPDTPPQFQSSSINASLQENILPPHFITSIVVTDPDLGDAGLLSLQIDYSALDGILFILNSTTGDLYSNYTFDREASDSYQLSIIAIDFAQIPLTSYLLVNITILDQNDNSPFLLPNSFNRILEAKPIATVVDSNLTVLDNDIGLNAQLSYSILSILPENHFTINNNTGLLYTDFVLDITVISSYNICILVQDNTLPYYNLSFCIEIQVLDGNFNPPIFSRTQYNTTLLESSPIGFVLIDLLATDSDFSDDNNLIFYFLNSTFPTEFNSTFSINNLNGSISLIGEIDREYIHEIIIPVIAIDQPLFDLPKSAVTYVTVYLEDVNEFPPYFNTTNASIIISEGVLPNTLIFNLLAADNDADTPNNEIRYSIAPSPYSYCFYVNEITGNVYTQTVLDRETVRSLSLTFYASDLGIPSLNSTFILFINLSDINDNSPQLSNTTLYSAENQLSPYTIDFLQTVDNDRGNNGTIYTMFLQDNLYNFTLNNVTGELISFITFDREDTPFYNLTVVLIDSGIPQLQSVIHIIIIVTDVNDNPPVFIQESYKVFVREDTTPNTFIMSVTATDYDINTNAIISYTIGSQDFFQIESDTGNVRSIEFLDFESVTEHVLLVYATDGIFIENTTLTVYLIDVNDNPPVFILGYQFTIKECASAHTYLGSIETTDIDSYENNTFTEYTTDSQYFSIHSESGLLKTLQAFDRAIQKQYIITVIANNTLAEFPLYSVLDIYIFIEPVADSPKFSEQLQNIEINEVTQIGALIYTFQVLDYPHDSLGVSYSIQAGNIDNQFYLNSSTGGLFLQEQLSYYKQPLYALSIVAIENSLFRNASTILNIYITNYELKFPIFHYQISLMDSYTDTLPFLEFYLHASDHPLRQTDALMFEITSGDIDGIFSLTNSGSLSVVNSSQLQLTTQPTSLTVSVANYLGQTAQTNVTISISSIALIEPVINFIILENITDNSVVGYIPVYDSISILSGNDDNIFQIISGEITVINSITLNYELQSLYTLSVFLQNTTLQVYAIVNIELIDVNEFDSVFASDMYYFSFQFPKEYQNISFPLAIFDKDSHEDDYYLDIEDNDNLIVSINSNRFIINQTATNITKTLNISLKTDNAIIDFAYIIIYFQSYETNSNQPIFNNSVFSYIIKESDSFIGQRLDVITATDADQGIYGQLTYGLSGDHNDRDFIVHPFTGLITINFPLDYETQSDYNLVLYAYDSVSPCLSASTRITVTVLDSNDHSPIFQQGLYSSVILENSTVSTEILQVVADDGDSIFEDLTGITGDFGLVMYNLSSNNTDFSINSLDGIISIALPLDREMTSEYNITVIATDGGGLYDKAIIIITLLDVNDNPPMFENSTLSTELLEHAVVGTEIGLFLATDPDVGVNAFINYEIIEGNDGGLFYLDPVTQALYSNTSFDREIVDTLMITIEARDAGEPQLTSQVSIEINIIDINDNSPEFSHSLYNISIIETLPVDSIVFNITATDLDTGHNSMLFYSILSGNLFDIFSLDPQSGSLYLESSLDYESIQDYTLIIQVTDANVLQSRSANTTLLIYVINANDNFPVFSQLNYTEFIPESIQADTFILQVMASDNDQGPNASLLYFLDFTTEPSTQGLFYIEYNTGRIFVGNYNFDFEAIQVFSFQVVASDYSTTPLTTAVFVYILLENDNDNVPIFPQNITQLFIEENLNFPNFITTFNATDLDGDSLVYTLHKFTTVSGCIQLCGDGYQCQESITDPNDLYYFSILENSGELYSNTTFDRELRENYLFILSASDLFNDPSYVCLSIDIIDINDNPPIPVQTEYYIDLGEELSVDEFLTLQATDDDGGQNSDLFWMISSISPPYQGFLIHPMIGALSLMYGLDREIVSSYQLNITVSDRGLIPLQAIIAVFINVTDINDNEPLFAINNQTIDVLESSIPGDILILLNATDNDIAGNAMVIYSLTPSIFFDIYPETGEVYVASELDYESITVHNLIVTARDNGIPSLHSNITLEILIIDSNDNPPVFSSDVYNTTLIENIIYNESIITLIVTDADTLYDNTHVSIQIIQIEPNEPNFYISGNELMLSDSLDAETSSVYKLTIQVTNDIPINNLVTMTTIYVYISDKNDNLPTFTSSIFFGSINEASSIGYSILQVIAIDNDVDVNNSEISFSLEINSNSSFFSINSISGELELINSVDFEINALFTFNVIATDNGLPALTSTSIIQITVVDSNDNPPYFTQIFSFYIPENTIGLLGNITGSDVDNNTIIEYAISSASVYDDSIGIYYVISSDIFSIDPVSGMLSLLQELDRESADTYLVEITISDSIHFTSVNVTVYITDTNDNTPVTGQPSYTLQIYEGNDVLDSVFIPEVIDLDIDINAVLIFKFSSRYPSDGFSIDINTGEVLVEFVLDRESEEVYTLEIEITNLGTPALFSYTVLDIQVLDVNDNIPVISQPSYQFNILENSPFGLHIENFNATDDDIELNGELEFFLNDLSLPFHVFTNGSLYLDSDIDYETLRFYNFSLFVRDLGSPPLTTSSQLSIHIIDTNDNNPMFENTPLTVSISEYTPTLSTVFTLTASDIDATTNAEYYFAINQGNTEFKFSIDELTGEIFTIDTIDYELTESYELSVLVIDRGTPTLFSTEQLEIQLIDENDNIPMFSEFEYQFSIPEDFPIHTSIYRVYASDLDSGLNSLIEFSIDLEDIFSINSTSGEIQLLQELNFEEKRIYSLQITAKDNGNPQQSSSAYLHLQLLDVNEYPPYFPLTEVVIFISNSILIGSQIFQTTAYDLDYYGTPISYELLSNPLNQYININSQDGDIYLENLFSGLTGNYSLIIQASDGDYYSQMSLKIVLHDANAFSLSFSQPSFYFLIPDNSNVGSIVADVTGYNIDIFDISTNTESSQLFSITADGDIILLDFLDPQTVYSSNLFAMNSQDTIQTVITIEVFATQNNPPIFSSLNYYVHLSEALPIATTFLTIYAIDNDVTDQGVSISYTISDGDEFALFSIDSQTGRLSIAEKIDREITPLFNLTIQAAGNGIGMTYVVIIIDDVNDNAPVFSEDVYRATVVSDIPAGTLILQAIANDNDAGRNSDISYAIVSQPIPSLFAIDPYSGDIRLNSSLIVYDYKSYAFYISATDNGLPLRLTTEIQVYFTIDHPNLYDPVFTTLSTNSTIPETTQDGTLIAIFYAFDLDTNTSDGVYYSLSNYENLPFSLSNKGELYLTSTLDYLQAIVYRFVITATDSGTPTRNSTLDFAVFVEDINNHLPIFSQDSYEMILSENYQIQTPFITISATDLDATSITYIISLNSYIENGEAIFSISSDTGVMSLAIPLDYETLVTHELLITARDQGYSITQFNSVTLTVMVQNVNDNPPIFSPTTSITAIVPRLSMAGIFVSTVSATDLDSVSILYSILSGNGDGLFAVDGETGDVTLARDVGAFADSLYNVQLLAFDGELSSTGLLQIEISDNASYCYDGLCTDVLPSVICTTADCTTCPLDFILSTTSTFCFLYTCFSSDEYLCGEQQPGCISYSLQCNGVCSLNYSLCAADNLCYPNTISSLPCDNQNTICLNGYILVQLSDQSRVCTHPSDLPAMGQICNTLGKVYCDEIDSCQNIQNNPSLCQLCSSQEFQCPDTNECVSSSKMCCSTSDYFCNITDSCLSADLSCPPVSSNIAPTIPSKAILLPSSSLGSVIGLLLGDGTAVGVDTQMEEVAIAIICQFPVDNLSGYWQYIKCRDGPTDVYGACSVLEYPWIDLPVTTSIDNAFILPPNYRIRFVRMQTVLEGSVWLRAHLWDGFNEAVETDSLSVVREADPHFAFLPPFESNSAFSQEYLYFVSIFNPVTSFPAFISPNIVSFPDIEEDYSSLQNNGVLLSELLGGVYSPNLYVISTTVVLGLPPSEATDIQNSLPSSSLTSYFSSVVSTNIIRSRRLSVTAGFLLASVNDDQGVWQVTATGRQSDWYPITSILDNTNQLLYIPLESRVRFIPNEHTHSTATISIHPWDGTSQGLSMQTVTIRDVTYQVANVLPTAFALGDANSMSLHIISAPDNPVVIINELLLPTIPYFIQYRRDNVFVIELEMSVDMFKQQQDLLSNYFAVLFHSTVSILYFEPLASIRCLASFRVEELQLSLSDISTELELSKDVLVSLGFNITQVTQDTFVGQGHGCFDSSLYAPNTGESAGVIANTNGYDGDDDIMGLAVVQYTGDMHGIWQYYRSDVPPSVCNSLVVNWITLPDSISETNAFLLRPSDCVRFSPHPQSYWLISTAPTLTVKLWDISVGSITQENDMYHANTDPYTTTVHSTINPIGLFSTDTIRVIAHRQDCTGSADSNNVYDACCICGGSGTTCMGCKTNVSIAVQYDTCRVCGGDDSTCAGCDLVPFSYSQVDEGNICRSDSSNLAPGQVTTYFDCEDTPFGLALVDDCNACTEGDSVKEYNYLK